MWYLVYEQSGIIVSGKFRGVVLEKNAASEPDRKKNWRQCTKQNNLNLKLLNIIKDRRWNKKLYRVNR